MSTQIAAEVLPFGAFRVAMADASGIGCTLNDVLRQRRSEGDATTVDEDDRCFVTRHWWPI